MPFASFWMVLVKKHAWSLHYPDYYHGRKMTSNGDGRHWIIPHAAGLLISRVASIKSTGINGYAHRIPVGDSKISDRRDFFGWENCTFSVRDLVIASLQIRVYVHGLSAWLSNAIHITSRAINDAPSFGLFNEFRLASWRLIRVDDAFAWNISSRASMISHLYEVNHNPARGRLSGSAATRWGNWPGRTCESSHASSWYWDIVWSVRRFFTCCLATPRASIVIPLSFGFSLAKTDWTSDNWSVHRYLQTDFPGDG